MGLLIFQIYEAAVDKPHKSRLHGVYLKINNLCSLDHKMALMCSPFDQLFNRVCFFFTGIEFSSLFCSSCEMDPAWHVQQELKH